MAITPEHTPADDKRAGKSSDAESPKGVTADDKRAAKSSVTEAESPKGVVVGDVIDGWTVQAINNPTDVVVVQGAERRCLTLQELERAKLAAPPSPKLS